jgi:hypothetical protein
MSSTNMQGFHHRGVVNLPILSNSLYALYWLISVEGRNISKRRKQYRSVIEKIKLKLVEEGHCPDFYKCDLSLSC